MYTLTPWRVACLCALLAPGYGIAQSHTEHQPPPDAGLDVAMPEIAGLPLKIDSAAPAGLAHGQVSSEVDFPFTTVHAALSTARGWCGVLVLHPNVKACTYAESPPSLELYVGTKHFQTIAEATRMRYRFTSSGPIDSGSLSVSLQAPEGPLGTRDYQIRLEARPAENDHTLIRLSYRHTLGIRGKLALEAYLNTIGRDKVGFTVIDPDAPGRAGYVTGLRALTERNAVRYYLAIVAYLENRGDQADLISAAARWYRLTERYPQQLYEVSEDEYLRNKTKEFAQQQALQASR